MMAAVAAAHYQGAPTPPWQPAAAPGELAQVVTTQEWQDYQAKMATLIAKAAEAPAPASEETPNEARWKVYLFNLCASTDQAMKGPAKAIPPKMDCDRQALNDWRVSSLGQVGQGPASPDASTRLRSYPGKWRQMERHPLRNSRRHRHQPQRSNRSTHLYWRRQGLRRPPRPS